MLQTLFTLSIQTVFSKRGWASRRFPRRLWGCLPPMPPLTSAHLLWVCTLLISPTFCIILLFWFSIRGSLQALLPLFNIIGCSWNFGVPCFLHGHPGPLAFIFFSTTALMMMWQSSHTVFLKASICVGLLSQLNGPLKLNSVFLALW